MKSRERSWSGAGLESVYRAQPSPGCRCSRVGQSSPSLARLDLGPAISASGRIVDAMDPGVFDSPARRIPQFSRSLLAAGARGGYDSRVIASRR